MPLGERTHWLMLTEKLTRGGGKVFWHSRGFTGDRVSVWEGVKGQGEAVGGAALSFLDFHLLQFGVWRARNSIGSEWQALQSYYNVESYKKRLEYSWFFMEGKMLYTVYPVFQQQQTNKQTREWILSQPTLCMWRHIRSVLLSNLPKVTQQPKPKSPKYLFSFLFSVFRITKKKSAKFLKIEMKWSLQFFL